MTGTVERGLSEVVLPREVMREIAGQTKQVKAERLSSPLQGSY